MEPATNWFDESFATILKSHERFARQQRSRPSITYHVTSANSRIDHQLSGIKNIVLMHGHTTEKRHIPSCSLSFRFLDPPKVSHYILKLLDSCFKTRRTTEDAPRSTIRMPVLRRRRYWFWESTRLSLGSPKNSALPAARRQQHIQHIAWKLRPYALLSTKFQTLFHPLIRVFFNFRSSYLFAIGLPYIFSFGSYVLSLLHTSVSTCATRFSCPMRSQSPRPCQRHVRKAEFKRNASV